MKKYMVADLIKETRIKEDIPEDNGSGCNPNNKGGCKEYNPDIGEGPIAHSGKYYELEVTFDYSNDNYNVDISWDKGGSNTISVDGSDAADILANGLNEDKRNPPMPWPFGSKDYLHWPNQR